MVNIARLFRRLLANNALLTWTGLIMLGLLALNLAGLVLDHRIVTGAPVWLKPAKFALSTAIYSLSIAYVLGFVSGSRVKWGRIFGDVIALCLLIELAIIDLQAARGVTSHFNLSTPLDAAMFTTMGIAIGILWLGNVGLTVVLMFEPFRDRDWGWGLRLALFLTVIGTATGGLMTQPRAGQIAPGKPLVVGSHTVGGADGGPGLAGTNWSREHGDLRVAHFLGLHGLQVVPLLILFFKRRRATLGTARVFAIAASYALLLTIFCVQALRGQSVSQPDAATLISFAAWALFTLAAWWLAGLGAKQVRPHVQLMGVLG